MKTYTRTNTVKVLEVLAIEALYSTFQEFSDSVVSTARSEGAHEVELRGFHGNYLPLRDLIGAKLEIIGVKLLPENYLQQYDKEDEDIDRQISKLRSEVDVLKTQITEARENAARFLGERDAARKEISQMQKDVEYLHSPEWQTLADMLGLSHGTRVVPAVIYKIESLQRTIEMLTAGIKTAH